MSPRVWLALAGALAVWAPPLVGQRAFTQVDRIAAIVGRRIIPLSRLEEEINVFRQQGGQLPTDPRAMAEFRRELLERMIDEELLIQAAERDTAIRVTDQDVQSAVETALRQVRSQFASELEYERNLREAGFASPDDYRRWVAEQKRRELLRNSYIDMLTQRGQIKPLPPTEAEMRAFYDQNRAQQPRRPPSVSFQQIIVRAVAHDTALREAFRRADSLARAIRAGADFNQLARRYSDDPGTRDQGGEMGWVRRGGGLIREFEDAAFSLRPGAVSRPVQTPYGFHVIQVVRSQPAEVQVRHILIAPTITDADRARAQEQAVTIRTALEAGASFDSLAALYHDPIEQRTVDDASREDLPPAYRTALENAEPGDVIGPIELNRGDGRPKFAVIVFREATPAGEYTYEELRDLIRRRLAQENALKRYLRKLREQVYVDIRL